MDIHELTAAYALDALRPDEAEAYEAKWREEDKERYNKERLP